MKITLRYEPVSVTGRKSGKCLCGKKLTRQKKFEETINPWNTNEDGLMKTSQEVNQSVRKKAREWEKLPVRHDIPGYWSWTDEMRKDYDAGKTIEVTMSCGFTTEINKRNKV